MMLIIKGFFKCVPKRVWRGNAQGSVHIMGDQTDVTEIESGVPGFRWVAHKYVQAAYNCRQLILLKFLVVNERNAYFKKNC